MWIGPGVQNPILHDRITDDKFCIAFDTHDISSADAEKFLKATGATEISNKII